MTLFSGNIFGDGSKGMDHEAFGTNIENDILNMIDEDSCEPSRTLKVDIREDNCEESCQKKDMSFDEHEGYCSTKSSQNGNSPRDMRDDGSVSPTLA